MSLIIKDVLVFTGRDFIENAHVVVDNGIITSFGAGEPRGHDGIEVISRPEHTLMPGLIDSHIHALQGNIRSIEQSLRFGVTTVCDLANEPKHLINLTKLASDPVNKAKYADFKCCGFPAKIRGGWPEPVLRREFEHMGMSDLADKVLEAWPRLESPSEAESFVTQQISQSGASYIKLMNEIGDTVSMDLPRPAPELQKALVVAAHKHGLIAIGHAFSYAGAMDLVDAGADGLAHMFLDEPPNDDWIGLMKEKNMHCNPTLCCGASLTSVGDEMQQSWVEDPLAQRMLFDLEPRENLGFASGCQHARVDHAIKSTAALYEAGVPLLVGSDAAGQPLGSSYGLGVHMEMHRMVHQVGMTPEDVLRSATSLIAERYGFRDRGSIRDGARADLLLIDGDVRQKLADEAVRCLPVKGVWREGVLTDVYEGL